MSDVPAPQPSQPSDPRAIIEKHVRHLPPTVLGELNRRMFGDIEHDLRSESSSFQLIDALFSNAVAEVRSDVVRASLQDGHLNHLFCEALTYESLFDLARDAFSMVVDESRCFSSDFRAVAIYDFPAGRRSLAGRTEERAEAFARSGLVHMSSSIPLDESGSRREEIESVVQNAAITRSRPLQVLREITLLSDEEREQMLGTEMAEELKDFDILVTPVRYGDVLVAMAIAFGSSTLRTSSEFRGSALNQCIVVSDALARAIAHLERVRRHTNEVE